MGVPATGRDIALPGITILRFEGDRTVERFSQADMLGLLVQIGGGARAGVAPNRRRRGGRPA
jgi:hypothetical protein